MKRMVVKIRVKESRIGRSAAERLGSGRTVTTSATLITERISSSWISGSRLLTIRRSRLAATTHSVCFILINRKRKKK